MKSRPIVRQQKATHNPMRWRGHALVDHHPVELQLVTGPARHLGTARKLELQQRYPPASWQTIAWVANADEAEWFIEHFYATTFEVTRV